MKQCDPYFDEAFYNNSFHPEVLHEWMLKKICCYTVIMKAKVNFNNEGILLAAMGDEYVEKENKLIGNSKVIHFNCGHGFHIEKKKEFLQCLME